jgi:hypothetical protein
MTVDQFVARAKGSDFIEVINEIDHLGCVPRRRNSAKFSISYPEGKFRFYPPKYVLMRAAELKAQVKLSPCSGGSTTNTPLTHKFNFTIEPDHPSTIPEC